MLMSVLLGQRLDGGAVRTAADEGRRSWFGWTSPPRCVHDAASKRQLEGRQGDVGRQAAPTPTLLADSRQVLQRIDEIDCVVDSGQVDDWLLRRAALAEKELLRKMEQAQPFDLDTRGDRMHRSIAEPRMPLLRNRHASWRPVCMEAHVGLRRADAWSQGER